ncbi:phosphoglycolate phosphatase [Pigmentiphaga litoralis]|uniref:HAD family hydrolase n=1 Tax=Pigmentiphaga litoralis TaxID=516702 RepID=UPI0016764C31|nr:HAD family hydrolase [Pigmentiphaga litoralis]GGX32237.1 phosphoglycolate phosphatase [Pigmentiphaga litoralis]
MRFMALATDYDNTLAFDGQVADATWDALDRLCESGRQVFLVSGRELDDLLAICPRIERFTRVVAENGGVLYDPATRERRLLAPPPPPEFVDAMRAKGVRHLGVSETLVATMKPHDREALDAIRELGLDLHVVFNGDAVMVLAPGVTKGTGLTAALEDTGLSPHNVVAVGDAENDHHLLALCEMAVAVNNALPMLKKNADMVTQGEHGHGVIELVDALLDDDLRSRAQASARHGLLVGQAGDEPFTLPPYGTVTLACGPSGSGKSTLTTALIERLVDADYQVCIFDPEGDYGGLEGAVTVGDTEHAPPADQVLELLAQPRQSVIVNLLRVPLADRPRYFATLLPRLLALRAKTGRPHWLVFEEAHHLFPTDWSPAEQALPVSLETAMATTVQPDQLAPAFLDKVTTVLAVGPAPAESLATFHRARNNANAVPDAKGPTLERGQVWVCQVAAAEESGSAPSAAVVVNIEPGRTHRRRHVRKYAEGLLIPERSFFFRGPEDKLNLRAHNLVLFVELGDGVDDDTWTWHLQRGDYSRWFEDVIGDSDLAEAARQVEADTALDSKQSRARIRDAIESRYTQPENPNLPVIGHHGESGKEA